VRSLHGSLERLTADLHDGFAAESIGMDNINNHLTWWLMKAMPWIMACQRKPNISATEAATSGPTPSHRKPMMAANTSVPAGVAFARREAESEWSIALK
jgi:hypothetical protein